MGWAMITVSGEWTFGVENHGSHVAGKSEPSEPRVLLPQWAVPASLGLQHSLSLWVLSL